jgi:hypothetical protein
MTTIADNAGPSGPTMNDRGTVAFRADLGSRGSGIYTGRDGLIASIAATGDAFSAFHGLPVVNSRGVVAFRADLTSGGQGIYLGDGGPPVVVAETGLVISSLGNFPVVDDAGSVAFCASLAGGGSGVFAASAGVIETMIYTTGAFESFRGVLLGDATSCGSRMAGTNSRERRYYRCLGRCGRPHVRADHLEGGVLDLIRSTLFTPDAIRQRVTLLNKDMRLRAEHRGATVRDLFERVDVESRELKAVAIWNMTTGEGVNRSDAVSEWLRR